MDLDVDDPIDAELKPAFWRAIDIGTEIQHAGRRHRHSAAFWQSPPSDAGQGFVRNGWIAISVFGIAGATRAPRRFSPDWSHPHRRVPFLFFSASAGARPSSSPLRKG